MCPVHNPLVRSSPINHAVVAGVLRVHPIGPDQILGAFQTIAHAGGRIAHGIIWGTDLEGPIRELAEAVRTVARGGRVVDPMLATEVVVGGPNPLTEREREVLAVALDGRSAADIAAKVHLSPGTVRNHLSSAIGKTSTSNRVEAARRAQDLGWL